MTDRVLVHSSVFCHRSVEIHPVVHPFIGVLARHICRTVYHTTCHVRFHIRFHHLAALMVVALLSLTGLASAQGNDADFGYTEGRILSIDPQTRMARVQLGSGQIVEADLGQPLPEEYAEPNLTLPEFREGQQVELYYSRGLDGSRRYDVSDWVRRPALYWLVGLFLLVSVVIARGKGLRAFISTAAALIITIAFIVPAILAGYNPIVISLVGIGGILILAIYFVHGLSWSTTAALVGTFTAVLTTMVLGLVFTELAHLTGFGSEEAMYISLGAGQVNLKGMLLAGLMIGALGALTDITIVQASVVREVAHANARFGLRDLYRIGMNVGLDHIGSLVNTLVLAYTGAALPLLVLLNLNNFSLGQALNLELVAAEIVHTLVGSIGLILAVPLTTFIAAALFRGDRLPIQEGELDIHQHGAPADVLARARQRELLSPVTAERAAERLSRHLDKKG